MGTGIGVWRVMKMLGDNHRSVGSLCRSNKINEDSFYKPIDLPNVHKVLTEQDYFNANDGFTNLSFNSVSSLKTALLNGDYWNYVKPTVTYRLRDFEGYDHGAVPFYQLTLNSGVNHGGPGNTIYFEMDIDSKDLDWIFNFNYLKNKNASAGLLDFGYLVWSMNTNGTIKHIFFYKKYDIVQIPEKGLYSLTFPLNNADLTSDTYNVLPAFRTHTGNATDTDIWIELFENSDTYEYWYYPLKCNVMTITYNQYTPQINPIEYVRVRFYNVVVTSTETNGVPYKKLTCNASLWIDSGYDNNQVQSLNIDVIAQAISEQQLINFGKSPFPKGINNKSDASITTVTDNNLSGMLEFGTLADKDGEVGFPLKLVIHLTRESGGFGMNYSTTLTLYTGNDITLEGGYFGIG